MKNDVPNDLKATTIRKIPYYADINFSNTCSSIYNNLLSSSVKFRVYLCKLPLENYISEPSLHHKKNWTRLGRESHEFSI